MDPGHKHFSLLGAVFWFVVLVWLTAMLLGTSRRCRGERQSS
jgi:hypothetical protein